MIGDSHSQEFLNSVLENNFLQDYQISTRYISGRCQIPQGDNKARKIAGKDQIFCAKSDTLALAEKASVKFQSEITCTYRKKNYLLYELNLMGIKKNYGYKR